MDPNMSIVQIKQDSLLWCTGRTMQRKNRNQLWEVCISFLKNIRSWLFLRTLNEPVRLKLCYNDITALLSFSSQGMACE